MISGFFKILFIALISMLLTLISFVIFDAPNMKNIIQESNISENINFTISNGKNIPKFIVKIIKNELGDENLDENYSEDLVNSEIFEGDLIEMGLLNFFSENFDFINSIEDMESKEYKVKLDHKVLDKFTSLDISAQNITFAIKKGEEYSYTIYGKQKGNNPHKNLKIEKSENDDKYEISGNSNFKKYKIEITTPNPNDLNIEFLSENGVLRLEDSIKKLRGNIENGVFIIKGEDSYPIDIYGENVVVNMKLSNYDADIEVKTEKSISNILGMGYLKSDNAKTIRKTIGSGRDKIEIVAENAVINIVQ